jgi:hypothetical protein
MDLSDHIDASAALQLGKEPPYLLNRCLVGSQIRSRRDGEEKDSDPWSSTHYIQCTALAW